MRRWDDIGPTIENLECWHVTINIHPQVVPCDNIHSWVVTCDNIHPWDRLSFRVPAPAAWPGAKRPSLGLFLSSARLKICPATGHRTLAVTAPRRHQRRLRTHYGCIYAMLWWVGSWVCGVRAALQDYHCPDFLVSTPQCPMEIFMPGCSGEIINFPDFLDNNFQYLDVRQSGTECMCSRNIIKYKN